MRPPRAVPEKYQLVETRLQERLDEDRTRCHLCPWRCTLRHGQRGFCQAHVNRNGTLYNLTYGIVSAIDVGPIEAKPVRHYRPGTQVMSVGSYGCNFRCGGCHNREISWGKATLDALARGQATAAYVTPQELVDSALRHGADGIALTYSEPAVWLEYAADLCGSARAAGLYTVYVSNSFVTAEALEIIAPSIDVLCSDIKSLEENFYREICGAASPHEVLASIETAHRLGVHVETRTNIIPGKNDDIEMMRAIAAWIRDRLGADSPWHITRFFPAYGLDHLPETPGDALWRAHDAARAAGLRNVHVYDGRGCDCAGGNLPVAAWLDADASQLHAVKKCAGGCCGDDGMLLRRPEN